MPVYAEQVQKKLKEILVGFNAVLEENGIEASVSHFMLTNPDDPNSKQTQQKIRKAIDGVFGHFEDQTTVAIAGCWLCCNEIECRMCCLA